MEPFYIEDCPKISINSKGWYLQGFSRAGDRTGFILYPQKFLFDCGVRTNTFCEFIFMTHVHTDHSLELPSICNRHRISKSNSNYHVYAPSTSIQHLILLERCVSQLSFPESASYSDEDILRFQRIQFQGINAGDILSINDGYEVTVLESHHTIQAVGYGLTSLKKKLKTEYLSMMSDESIDKKQRVKRLEELKKLPGIEINEIIRTPELVFFCDSSIHNLFSHDEWKQYPVIVCECTGLQLPNKKTDEEYLAMGHTCLGQLLPILLQNKEKKWILIHVSTSLKKEEIQQIENQLKTDYELDVHVYY